MISDIMGDGETRERFEQALPLGRVGSPEDVGAMAVWLASDEASHVTGSYFLVDGGQHDGAGAAPVIQTQRELAAQFQGDALLAEIDRLAAADREAQQRSRRERGVF